MRTVELQDYSIVVDEGLGNLKEWINGQGYSQYIVLVDENTKESCWPVFKNQCEIDVALIEIKSGELYKNLVTCQQVWKTLLSLRIDRNALFINLGGGVIGDMGGFVASCYKRGIDFINIPTTVLAQVDASIGGKLGVDFEYGKNLIGLFKNPKRIHISTAFYASLPRRQFINGFAEIFKHALIADKLQWDQLKRAQDLTALDMNQVVYDSLLVKKNIVENDPFEYSLRKTLNFGHTIGHAIETFSLEKDKHPLLHGEAIAIGMLLEAFLSLEKCGLSQDELKEICDTLGSIYPRYAVDVSDMDKLWEFMLLDKKNEKTQVMAALLESIGKAVINIPLEKADLKAAILFYNDLNL